jgi:hypothetical protein
VKLGIPPYNINEAFCFLAIFDVAIQFLLAYPQFAFLGQSAPAHMPLQASLIA